MKLPTKVAIPPKVMKLPNLFSSLTRNGYIHDGNDTESISKIIPAITPNITARII